MLKLAILTAVGVPVMVIAQEAADAQLPAWAQWGVLGLIILGFVTKQLVPGWLYADIKAENKELKAENTRLVALALDIQKATLPAIEASTSAVSEALSEIRSHKGRSA